ncbi:hypothetical protein AFR_33560 [Actinoplanes friuliensis DSM 7358]|uniref:Mycothiol-dependent maleylpyruvate isomerase metal-binding domain-containing protein n=1 Tax=Actinoplanes friuliensis DSM 7358 TaxID=1246995 RepID=U5WAF2_9ACTN|nr:hypothetical protein AFR_33560 [Actinoplanes friuliensis DSM 7358]
MVARISPSDLALATPCAEWDLGALLAHMTVQHRGFAAAAAGRGGDPEVWRAGTPSVDAYLRSADEVIAAFAAHDNDFLLPEITARPVPRRMAIGFHLVDYVVHGWDVATALGLGYDLPTEVLAAALPIAEAVPEGSTAFAAPLPDPGGSTFDRILTRLGRSVGPRG